MPPSQLTPRRIPRAVIGQCQWRGLNVDRCGGPRDRCVSCYLRTKRRDPPQIRRRSLQGDLRGRDALADVLPQ